MNRHITLEELTKFVWLEELNTEAVALSLRINQHLMACEVCVQRVERLQQLYRQTRQLRNRREQLRLVNQKLQQVNQELMGEVCDFCQE